MIAILGIPFEAVKLVCFLASGEKEKTFKKALDIILVIIIFIVAYHCWLDTTKEILFFIALASVGMIKDALKSNQSE